MAAAGGHWSKNGRFIGARQSQRQAGRRDTRQTRRSSGNQLAALTRRLILR